MQTFTTKKLRYFLKWLGWIIVIQIVLINISAAIYAYKFTHFNKNTPPPYTKHNIFIKTWKLFTGPTFYMPEEIEKPLFPFENVHFTTSDQINIDSWYSPSDSSIGCVILFHAVSTNKSFLIDQASEFKKLGYAILLPDFRGHGNSGGESSSFGAKESDEVGKAIAYARSRGNRKIILYGFSMGSVAIMKYIHDSKVQPDAIIIECPFDTLHHLLQSRARVLGFPIEPFASLVTLWIGIENGYNGFKLKGSEYAKSITCPVLLGWGQKDKYISNNDIKSIYENLSSQNKQLAIYPEADHGSYLIANPVLWTNNIESFIHSLRR